MAARAQPPGAAHFSTDRTEALVPGYDEEGEWGLGGWGGSVPAGSWMNPLLPLMLWVCVRDALGEVRAGPCLSRLCDTPLQQSSQGCHGCCRSPGFPAWPRGWAPGLTGDTGWPPSGFPPGALDVALLPSLGFLKALTPALGRAIQM